MFFWMLERFSKKFFHFFMSHKNGIPLWEQLGLTPYQLAVILGTILGDAGVSGGKEKVRLKVEHCEKQRAYVEWKLAQLPESLWSRTKGIMNIYDSKKDYKTVSFQTNVAETLTEVRDFFYVQNAEGKVVKTITPQLLSCFPA